MDFGNHRYINEQNCILFIGKYDIKINCAVNCLPPNPKTVPTALIMRISLLSLAFICSGSFDLSTISPHTSLVRLPFYVGYALIKYLNHFLRP